MHLSKCCKYLQLISAAPFFKWRKLGYIMKTFAAANSQRSNNSLFKCSVRNMASVVSFLKD